MSEIDEVLHRIMGVTKSPAQSLAFWNCRLVSADVPVCLASVLSQLLWLVGESAPSSPLIQAWRRPSDTKETEAERLNRGEADGGGGNVWGQDWGKWQLHGQETDFSYLLITAGSSPGDWIKEMHLVFACCSGNWVFFTGAEVEIPFFVAQRFLF